MWLQASWGRDMKILCGSQNVYFQRSVSPFSMPGVEVEGAEEMQQLRPRDAAASDAAAASANGGGRDAAPDAPPGAEGEEGGTEGSISKQPASEREQAVAVFYWLQIFSACLAAFAHGSNDTSHAAGPFSAVFGVWRRGRGSCADAPVEIWVLAVMGVGMMLGYHGMGWRVMMTFTHIAGRGGIDFHRGFCAELATAVRCHAGGKGLTHITPSHLVYPLLKQGLSCSPAATLGLPHGMMPRTASGHRRGAAHFILTELSLLFISCATY